MINTPKDQPLYMTPRDVEKRTTEDPKAKAAQQTDALFKNYEYYLKTSRMGFGGKSAISQSLEGQTIKLGAGGPDTGIPWKDKHSLAIALGTWDQLGDAWRGIAQILKQNGIADLIDIEQQDKQEEYMRQLYRDPEYGGSAKIGAVAGAIAEPLGLLMPLGKVRGLYKSMALSGVLGGLYGGALYVDKDESRLKNAAFTAVLMGSMGGVASKFFDNAVGGKVAGRINELEDTVEHASAINKVNDEANVLIKEMTQGLKDNPGMTPEQWAAGAAERTEYARALRTVEQEAQTEIDRIGNIWTKKYKYVGANEETGFPGWKVPLKPKKSKKKTKPTEKQSDSTIEDMEVRTAADGGKHAKVSEAGRLFNQVMQPIYDNVKKYSSKIAAKLRNADGEQHIMLKKWTERTKGFNEYILKQSKEVRKVVEEALMNGGLNAGTYKLIKETGGDRAVAATKEIEKLLDEVMSSYKDVGYKLNPLEGYFPRAVKDLDGLVKHHQSAIDKALAKAQAAQGGRALTQNQKTHIAERMFSFDIRFSNTAGNLKNRVKRGVKDDESQYYHDSVTTLHYYLATAAEDIAKRRFFKGFGHLPDGRKGLNVHGSDLDDSIGSVIDRIKADVPNFQDQAELVNLLRSRFSADIHKTHRFVQGIKNLSYAGTLGNWWSAMTQIGDLVFAMHKYGIKATVGSLLGARVATKERLGIEKAMQELNSDRGVTNKIADWAFKWSGFDKVDALGKNVNINASVRVNKKLAVKNPAAFKKKWQDHFGAETDDLITELQNLKLEKNADLSDNAMLMLWNDLAETQPIGLSEMPKKYLDMPNGRIVYAYKTFALKQFNYMRNLIIDKKRNPALRAYDATYFASLFVLANGGVDQFKDFMSGKPLNFGDKVTDNMLALVGTSKYAVDKSAGVGSIIQETITPVPLTQIFRALNGLNNVEVGGAVNQLPLIGKMNKEWGILK